ncbi:MAG: hypothetical protein E7294_05520 [Lachnospiraceae bacterium]|nr:hypothetical protein [Lachnospiraceae bacterium]
MKCEHCGAELGLLDQVCPYCGSTNTEAARHREEKEYYEERSRKAAGTIKGFLAANVPMVCSAILMFLLVTGILLSGYLGEKAYELVSLSNQKKAVRNYEKNMEKIRQYLEKGDYIGCLMFEEEKELRFCLPYEELCWLWDLSDEYRDAVNAVEELAVRGADADWLGAEDDISYKKTDIAAFYQEYEWLRREHGEDPYQKQMDDMKAKMDVILRIYLGLDDKEREEYLEGSENRQGAYLEEVLLHE